MNMEKECKLQYCVFLKDLMNYDRLLLYLLQLLSF